MPTALLLLAAGALCIWLGVQGLVRRSWIGGTPFIAAMILRAAGRAPRPKARWERAHDHIHLWLTLVLGIAAASLGLLGLISA